METSLSHYHAGRLSEAIAELGSELRRQPSSLRLRTFLFELLCFAGEFDRAEKQLDVLAEQNAEAQLGAALYKNLLRAHRQREEAFAAGVETADEEQSTISVRINGKHYKSCEDEDLRIGPSLEVYASGAYTRIRYREIEQVEITAPAKLRDLLLIPLGQQALRPMGFASDESLLQYTPRSFQGYRLLQEYFSFPEKFLFFALEGLQQAISVMQSQEFELLFYLSAFDQPERSQALEVGVSAQTLRLGCTPIVNLFEQTAEPILVTQERHDYPIIPDTRHQRMIETYSIQSVTATNPSRRTSVSIHPLFEHRFDPLPDEMHIFWRASRRQSPIDERRPSDMYLSIVDGDGVMIEPNAEILTVRCTYTNHDLPSKLTFGDEHGDFELESGAGVGSIRALHRPTTTYPPPAGAGQVWQLISQLSLNHLSLGETGLPAFQEILRIHNFTGAPHLDKQIKGILSMQSRRHIALMQSEFGSVAARGTQIEMELDESHFAGGGAYLFSAVMDRFLGLYVSMNSFSQLSVRTNARKELLGEWPPRTGSQVVM